ncbi:hypothetical protein B0H12DRAFT_1130295 [Mycena haematopus]|nr:hypothetical protein B0H12DRAFT_1130295 [Mycena haematopus]
MEGISPPERRRGTSSQRDRGDRAGRRTHILLNGGAAHQVSGTAATGRGGGLTY